jgi:pentatricopeptide repeat protein
LFVNYGTSHISKCSQGLRQSCGHGAGQAGSLPMLSNLVLTLEIHIYVGNALVDMYAKCTRMEDAHQMFDIMPNRNEFSWNTIIEGYAKYGKKI